MQRTWLSSKNNERGCQVKILDTSCEMCYTSHVEKDQQVKKPKG